MILYPFLIFCRCWLDSLDKAKDDDVLHNQFRTGIQFTDEMQKLVRREVKLISTIILISTSSGDVMAISTVLPF